MCETTEAEIEAATRVICCGALAASKTIILNNHLCEMKDEYLEPTKKPPAPSVKVRKNDPSNS